LVSKPALHVSDLHKAYRRRGKDPASAVEGVSFEILPGEVLGLLGPNGAGKTTTVKLSCGILHPDRGDVEIGGIDLQKHSRRARSMIGAVLEGSRNVYWRYSAMENLVYFAALRGIRRSEAKRRGASLLQRFGLYERRNEHVQKLSRGMQQKVAIAVSLVGEPPLLLLDEPTVALDVEASHDVRAEVKRLAHEDGAAILLTTHQMDVAEAVSDRVAIISDGRLLVVDTVANLRKLLRTTEYDLHLRGDLSDGFLSSLDPLPVVSFDARDGEGTLRLAVSDESDLYAALDVIRSRGVRLEAINHREPDLEQIYLHVVRGED
jgi:ABC-2 type transport system ATP-binding protein